MISAAGCKLIGQILVCQKAMRTLNLESCNINGQGTRNILDGLNRNCGLQNFNFAYNNMGSEVYEFSIKMAKILSRHLEIMHLDLSATGLKK
jgi:Ran GTPase-activating protein (RanGAP) involved in mRNA processing and transport